MCNWKMNLSWILYSLLTNKVEQIFSFFLLFWHIGPYLTFSSDHLMLQSTLGQKDGGAVHHVQAM